MFLSPLLSQCHITSRLSRARGQNQICNHCNCYWSQLGTGGLQSTDCCHFWWFASTYIWQHTLSFQPWGQSSRKTMEFAARVAWVGCGTWVNLSCVELRWWMVVKLRCDVGAAWHCLASLCRELVAELTKGNFSVVRYKSYRRCSRISYSSNQNQFKM